MIKNKEYKEAVRDERLELLSDLNSMLDKPMVVLAFIWLGLVIIDLTEGLNYKLLILDYAIWGVFILDFIISFIIAPDKVRFFKESWITGLSVLLPAFGILRLFRVTRLLKFSRFIRSINILRILISVRRGANELRNTLSAHGLGYILTFTIILTFAGAAGMANFESTESVKQAGYLNVTGLASYWDALWWTAMIMTTIGSQYWPVTVEGRVLGFLLALYAFVFLGYVAANLASRFIGSR